MKPGSHASQEGVGKLRAGVDERKADHGSTCSCRLMLELRAHACQKCVVQFRDGLYEQGGCMEIAQASGADMQGDHAEQAGLTSGITAEAALC